MILAKIMDGFKNIHHLAFQRLISGLLKPAGFVIKDMKIAISYKLQFVFQFSQVFFGVAIIYFVGKMLGDTNKSPLLKEYGANYFSFALVGLAVTSYMKAGLITITNDIRQMMNQGVFEALCAGPIGYKWLLLYTALWPFIFETVRVGFYFLIGMLVFGMRLRNANWLSAVVALVISMPIFLLLGITSCSILILVKRGDPINWIFTYASSLLAGTMFPVAVLPDWLRTVAFCLPLTHSLEALRRCLLIGASIQNIYDHLLALLIFIAILLPVTSVVNNICMRQAKKRGAFSTY